MQRQEHTDGQHATRETFDKRNGYKRVTHIVKRRGSVTRLHDKMFVAIRVRNVFKY